MSLKVVNSSNRKCRTPGTCNQTGNTAPRFPWPAAIRILIKCLAHFLGYTDDGMWRLRIFPNPEILYIWFIKMVPWFPEYYDKCQIDAAKAKGYPIEKLGLFRDGKGKDKVYNRLLYEFTEPGSRKRNKKRSYGISVENPDNPKGNRRSVECYCSSIIMRRLKTQKTINKAEVERWGSK
jgi:hypothetical protein